jgi:hypothetical protein
VNPAPDEELERLLGDRKIETALAEPSEFFGYGDPGDLTLRVRAERSEHDFLVEAPDQLRSKKAMQPGDYRPLQRREGKAGRAKELLSANIAGADDIETGKIIGSVIGEGDVGGIEHLQKQIPNEAMSFLNFVEQQNASLMPRENVSQASGAPGFVSDEELHAVQVQEFRHVEAKEILAAEEIAAEFESQFCLPYAGWSEKKEGTEWFLAGLESELAALQNRAHARNDVVLALDSRKQMRFESIQVTEGGWLCAHEGLAGLETAPFRYCRRA